MCWSVLAGAGLVGLLVSGFGSLAFAGLFLAFAVDLVELVVGEVWVAEDGLLAGGAAGGWDRQGLGRDPEAVAGERTQERELNLAGIASLMVSLLGDVNGK